MRGAHGQGSSPTLTLAMLLTDLSPEFLLEGEKNSF